MAANWDKFDALFTCPGSVTDADRRTGYEEFYATAKRECEGLDMSAAQIMRTSVMLGWFFKHQQTSRTGYGDKNGYQHPGQEKDAILAWEAVAKTWDDVRSKAKLTSAGATGMSPAQVRDVVMGVLAAVDDPAQRALLQDRFVEALSAA